MCALIAATACTQSPPAQSTADDAAVIEASTQAPNQVDLRVYLRQGRGADAHLVPVIREVPVTDHLPRTALQLLIAGPSDEDPPGVAAALPRSTQIQSFELRDGTAVIDLSNDALRGATSSRRRPEHGFLALTAIANTLTEFPDIEYVRLTVNGRRATVWGGWIAPRVLVRDETRTDEPERRMKIATPTEFRRRSQRIGVDRARRQRVNALRVHPTATYLRITAEISADGDTSLRGPVPVSSAERVGDDIVLRVRARARPALAGSLRGKFDDPAFEGGKVTVNRKRRTLVVRVKPRRPQSFWLHTLPDPSRVVLDIRR